MIGIIASKADNAQVVWALREGSTGEMLLDYAQAIKLALSKAMEQHWQAVKLEISSHKLLLHLLKTKKTMDVRLFAQMEDIHTLRLLFLKCSFILSSNESSIRSRMISNYAVCLTQDEECWFPPCLSTCL